MKDKIQNLKMQILKQDNLAVSYNLRIIDILRDKTKNLHQIIENICNVINIAIPPHKFIYRIKALPPLVAQENRLFHEKSAHQCSNDLICRLQKCHFEKNGL